MVKRWALGLGMMGVLMGDKMGQVMGPMMGLTGDNPSPRMG